MFYCFKNLGYPNRFSFELARLTTIVTEHSFQYQYKRWKKDETFIGYLPQGYPTSPLLANKVCYELDNELATISNNFHCLYTRYSDDIVFSSNNFNRFKAKLLFKEVTKVLTQYGFKRNHRKTSIIPPGARKIVTGLVVNHEEPKLKKEIKDKIRSYLYYTKKYGISHHCKKVGFHSIIGFQNHISGLINYARSIDKKLGDKYLTKFNEINWYK